MPPSDATPHVATPVHNAHELPAPAVEAPHFKDKLGAMLNDILGGATSSVASYPLYRALKGDMVYSLTQADVDLFNEVSTWAHDRGWTANVQSTIEDLPGSQEMLDRQSLVISLDTKRQVYLHPAGRRKDGTEVVDVFAVPTLARARLLRRPQTEGWEMVTDVGVPFHHPWDASNFLRLVEDLAAV